MTGEFLVLVDQNENIFQRGSAVDEEVLNLNLDCFLIWRDHDEEGQRFSGDGMPTRPALNDAQPFQD